MATFFDDLSIPGDVWLDVHDALGIATGTAIDYQNIGGAPVRVFIGTSAPSATDKHGTMVGPTDDIWNARPAVGEVAWFIGGSSSAGSTNKISVSLDAGLSKPSVKSFSSDFLLEVAKGNVPGHVIVEKFGRNPDISSNSDPEDIWNGGGLYTGFPTGAAETIDVSSGSAEDGAGTSTGLLSIRLFGQLAGVAQTEDITLNGTDLVTTIKLWDRMPRIRGLTVGSVGSNVGEITAHHTTTVANVFAVVPIGTNRTQIAGFTVPAGKTIWITLFDPRIVLPGGAQATGTVAIMSRESGTDFTTFEQTHTLDLTSRGPAPLPVNFAIECIAGTDVIARAVEVSGTSMSATAQFFGVQVDD